jgi:hypothetical protein
MGFLPAIHAMLSSRLFIQLTDSGLDTETQGKFRRHLKFLLPGLGRGDKEMEKFRLALSLLASLFPLLLVLTQTMVPSASSRVLSAKSQCA